MAAGKQANATKIDFLSRMSREIRTSMNAIIDMGAASAQSIGEHIVESRSVEPTFVSKT